MSEQRQRLLVKSAESMISLVREKGLLPDAALTKVAFDMDLLPAEIQRVAETYNQTRSLHHFTVSKGNDRLLEFPLADGEKVATTVFPSSSVRSSAPSQDLVKAARAGYTGPSRFATVAMTKTAEAPQPVISTDLSKPMPRPLSLQVSEKVASKNRSQQQWARDELGVRKELLKRAALRVGERVGLMHKLAGAARLDLSRLDNAIRTRYPDDGEKLASVVRVLAELPGNLGQTRSGPTLVDWTSEPYLSVSKFRDEMIATGQAASDLNEKSAFLEITQGVVGGIKGGLSGMSGEAAYDKEKSKAYESLQDPDHRDTMTRVKVKALLSDLLSNDEVISKYEPSEVLDHYNEITSLDPALATQPALIRGLLRRTLQTGSIDPFEVSQVLGSAKSLTENRLKAQDIGENLSSDVKQNYTISGKPSGAILGSNLAGIQERFMSGVSGGIESSRGSGGSGVPKKSPEVGDGLKEPEIGNGELGGKK